MVNDKYFQEPISSWMKKKAPEKEIVISSRVRLARNLNNYPFPMLITAVQAGNLISEVKDVINLNEFEQLGIMDLMIIKELNDLQKKVLVEKHLISLNLANESREGALLLNESESVSIMINEEDHIRIQCLNAGLQVQEAWSSASKYDDIFENSLNYAFDEKYGYLTSCPTNVGTGIRASVMVHLPALVLTNQINRIIPAITQVGLAVRGIYGEGSESIGNMFQISNQITLGQTEEEIIGNLHSVINQIIELEKLGRDNLVKESRFQIEDKVGRSLGILSNAKIIDSKEAAMRLSDIKLGIDLNMVKGVSSTIIDELAILIQPGFLQHIAKKTLNTEERDIRRATIIREKLSFIH